MYNFVLLSKKQYTKLMLSISRIKQKIGFYKDSATPKLSADRNILVKVYYAGICRTDIAVAKGTIAVDKDIILGHEFCGVVVDIHDAGKSQLHIGDAVSADPMKFGKDYHDCMCGVDCNGAFAEYIAMPEKAAVKLPQSLLSVNGAYLEPVAAALAPFKHIADKNANICLFGDNRIARLTEQIGHLLGYTNISCIHNTELLGECTCDIIIETAPEHLCEYIKALKPKGKLILKSRGYTKACLVPNDVAMKEISICGARYGSFDEAVKILASDQLDTKELFGDVYSLDEFETAFDEADKCDAKKIFFRICAE